MTEAEAWELAAQAIKEQLDTSLKVMNANRIDRRFVAAVHAMHATVTAPWTLKGVTGTPEQVARGAVAMADALLAALDSTATPTEPKEGNNA